MAERILPSKMVETVKEVRVLQDQVARFLEAMTRLTVRVEALEAAIKLVSRPG